MNNRIFIITILLCLASCTTKHTGMERCFEHIYHRIKPDSIVEKLMYSPIDSYDNFTNLINQAVVEDSKTDTICPESIYNYISENSNNTIAVNNIILFQQFQAYLRHQKFDQLKARDSALYFEKKRKTGGFRK